MAEKLNPDEMTSGQYGEALLQRKYRREEELGKQHRKDARINYAMQVLGGIDQIMVNRAALNMHERDTQLQHLINKETAEFNRLQSEYDAQAPWREASSPEAYARTLAIAEMGGAFDEKEWSKIPDDDPVKLQYDKTLKDLTQFHIDRYKKNRVSLPYDTAEDYTADLRALQGKRVPAGLLNWVGEKIGFRKPQDKFNLAAETAKYNSNLLTENRGKGKITPMSQELRDRMLRSPRFRDEKEVTVEDFKDFKVGTKTFTGKVVYKKKGKQQLIAGYEFQGGQFIDIEDLDPPSKTEIQNRIDATESKIISKLGTSATQTEIREELRRENPRLYTQAYGYGIYDVLGTPDKIADLKKHIAGNVTQIIEEPEAFPGFSKNDTRVRALTALQGNQAVTDSFTLAVAESAEYYQTHGFKNADGRITPIKDRAVAIQVALAEQLKGVELVAEGGWFGRDVGKFVMQPKGSVQPKVVEELREQAKVEDKERDSVPDADLSEAEKEERKTQQAKSEKALRNFEENKQVQNSFKRMPFHKRIEFLDKFEEEFGVRPIVDENLIKPPADWDQMSGFDQWRTKINLERVAEEERLKFRDLALEKAPALFGFFTKSAKEQAAQQAEFDKFVEENGLDRNLLPPRI